MHVLYNRTYGLNAGKSAHTEDASSFLKHKSAIALKPLNLRFSCTFTPCDELLYTGKPRRLEKNGLSNGKMVRAFGRKLPVPMLWFFTKSTRVWQVPLGLGPTQTLQ